MSFFGELVSSIETGKAPPRPPPTQKPTVPSTTTLTKPVSKPIVAPAQSGSITSSNANTLKRKVDDRDVKPIERITKPNSISALSSKVGSRPATPTSSGPNSGVSKPASNTPVSVPSTTSASTAPGKAPPKGSYADIMARAKQAQEQRTQSKVGLIKHQATSKEKVSKLAERRREEQEKLKSDKSKGAQKAIPVDKTKKSRTASPIKTDQPRVPKAPRPPLHAPASSYKGTMGMAANRSRDSGAARAAKRGRYDEYLGTDEEEDDEMEDYDDDDDGYGYGSDASSDMEAGIDDVEREEALALRAAKEDDARELALEAKLKREKEERRRKLEMAASKRR